MAWRGPEPSRPPLISGSAYSAVAFVLLPEFDLSYGQLCVRVVLLLERLGDGVGLVAATAWVTPGAPTSALAAIEPATAALLIVGPERQIHATAGLVAVLGACVNR